MPDTQIARLVDRFMRRIHAGVHHRAQAFDSDQIGQLGGMTLLTLADIEPAPIQELVRAMARDKSQMTRTLKRLSEKGMISREMSATDGRVCLVRLTPKGLEAVDGLRRILAQTIGEILEPMSEANRSDLETLLSQIDP